MKVLRQQKCDENKSYLTKIGGFPLNVQKVEENGLLEAAGLCAACSTRRNRSDCCCNTQESKCTGVNITIPSRFVSRRDVGILAQLMRDLKLEQVQGTLLSTLKEGQ